MSGQLIQNSQVGVNFISIWAVILILALVAFFAVIIITAILVKKRGRCLKEKEQIKNDYSKKLEEYPSFLNSESEENLKKRCEIKKELDENIKVIEQRQGKLESLYNFFDSSIYNLAITVIVVFVLGLMITNRIVSDVSGDVSSIIEVKNTTSQEVSVTAYYQIEYEGVHQKTLTVFVRNDSKNVLESANIIETKSNSQETIKYLEPGQEKIVSIDIYQNNQEDFQFTIDNIKFIE